MRISSLIALLFTATLGLAGCQTGKPIAMSVGVTPTNDSQNGDVLASYRSAGQDIPALKGTEVVTVRTYSYVRKPDSDVNSRIEVEDVACKLESDGYTASIRTPAEVRVPDYGYASRPITVQCNAPGYKPGIKTAAAFNRTMEQRMSNAGQGGLAGVVLVAMINAASDEKKHDFGYRPVDVTMNSVNCAESKQGCR